MNYIFQIHSLTLLACTSEIAAELVKIHNFNANRRVFNGNLGFGGFAQNSIDMNKDSASIFRSAQINTAPLSEIRAAEEWWEFLNAAIRSFPISDQHRPLFLFSYEVGYPELFVKGNQKNPFGEC